MAQKYLFVAEVDKIQEMLFRFSRQRQVLGGSRLLAHFCDEMEKLATKDHDAKVHTSMGGSFRISFDENHKDGIDAFEEKLALFYRLLLDGSLTSAGYLAYDSDDAESFCKTNRALQEKLRRKKEADKGQVDVTQASIIAFCQNSGSGLAIAQGALLHRENENNYLSKAAMDMGHAGGLGRYNQDDKKKPNAKRQALDAEEQAKEELQARKDDSEDNFLNTIREKIIDDTLKTFYWPRVIDEIGRMDPLQNNVAYVLADANGMGKLFGECESPEELETLSQMLDETIREAVAWPVEKLHTRMQERMDKKDVLPLLPLIVAGDDVFVLLPACYALDYAQHFCLKFQDAMSQKIENHATLKTLQNKIKNGSLPSPSISAAVVFCKTKYPYHLAHKRGEELLRQAKTLSKGNRDDKGRQIPSLAFEMIMGNQLVKAEDENGGPCTPTMNPYWLTDKKMGSVLEESVSLDHLLDARLQMKSMPQKRMAELREFFSPILLPKDNDDLTNSWMKALIDWLKRLKDVDPKAAWLAALKKHLVTLGNSAANLDGASGSGISVWHLRRLNEEHLRHGMLDLIEVWNYAQRLDQPLSAYEQDADIEEDSDE